MQFVPIPAKPQYLLNTIGQWFPFLEHVAKRSKEPIRDLWQQIVRGDIQLALVWDENKRKPCAMLGLCITMRGDDKIGEVRWLAGRDMKQWTHLLPDLEQYFRDCGCVVIRPICRPGWSRLIKDKGYRITHYIMEKVL